MYLLFEISHVRYMTSTNATSLTKDVESLTFFGFAEPTRRGLCLNFQESSWFL